MSDLLESVDWSGVECLNAKPDHGLDRALKQGYREDAALRLESDTDEQLLLHIPFQSAVKLSGLVVASDAGDAAPARVRLFVNRPTIGFAEAEAAPAAEDFELTDAQLAGEPVPLKVVKFRAVNVLTIFIASNKGGEDATAVGAIRVLGSAGDSFNVAAIKDLSKEHDH